jgi:hypothetical protein
MTEKVELLPHDGGFVLSEGNGSISREQVAIPQYATAVLKAGTVLGKRSNGKYYPFDQDVSTGEETAAGVLLNDVDATDGEVNGVAIVRQAEVKGDYLVYVNAPSTAEENAAIASLLTLGIVARFGPTRITTQES